MDDENDDLELEKHLRRLYESARVAWNQGRHAVAVELLSPYLRHRPEHANAWLWFGKSLDRLGLVAEAERALLRADEFEENKPYSETSLGNHFEETGHHELAEEYFAKAVEHPNARNDGWIWIMRGSNLARWNQLEAAERCHRRALELSDTDHDEAWLNIGLVLRARGQYDEAADAFNRALQITPDYENAKAGLASLQGIKGAVNLASRTPMPKS